MLPIAFWSIVTYKCGSPDGRVQVQGQRGVGGGGLPAKCPHQVGQGHPKQKDGQGLKRYETNREGAKNSSGKIAGRSPAQVITGTAGRIGSLFWVGARTGW